MSKFGNNLGSKA